MQCTSPHHHAEELHRNSSHLCSTVLGLENNLHTWSLYIEMDIFSLSFGKELKSSSRSLHSLAGSSQSECPLHQSLALLLTIVPLGSITSNTILTFILSSVMRLSVRFSLSLTIWLTGRGTIGSTEQQTEHFNSRNWQWPSPLQGSVSTFFYSRQIGNFSSWCSPPSCVVAGV